MAAKKSFPLRIDPDLHEALERWAGEEFRSVNGHIEYLLRESLKRAGRLPEKTARGITTKGLFRYPCIGCQNSPYVCLLPEFLSFWTLF